MTFQGDVIQTPDVNIKAVRHSYQSLRYWRQFVKRVPISYKRNVIHGGGVRSQTTKNGQNASETTDFITWN
jgi:hypothetical protein